MPGRFENTMPLEKKEKVKVQNAKAGAKIQKYNASSEKRESENAECKGLGKIRRYYNSREKRESESIACRSSGKIKRGYDFRG